MANPTGKGGFVKGQDPKRNTHGQRNAKSVAFSRSLREYIVRHGETKLTLPNGKQIKRIEAVVTAIYNEAIKGEGWACNFIADRVEGRVKEQIEHSGSVESVQVFNYAAIDQLLARRSGGDSPASGTG